MQSVPCFPQRSLNHKDKKTRKLRNERRAVIANIFNQCCSTVILNAGETQAFPSDPYDLKVQVLQGIMFVVFFSLGDLELLAFNGSSVQSHRKMQYHK